jgi:hypothetical protein
MLIRWFYVNISMVKRLKNRIKENYMRKNAFFKALSLLLIFSFSLSNISYAAGGDIRDCLAAASPFSPLAEAAHGATGESSGFVKCFFL